ncbi:hypothetical protein [Candidatus Paracaedibacter symbiosus]|uniref:hypothetical protein n=1 Tax=Candidatus Paracaedibacter symbiosus TaxID=244582 RepID=UPI000509623F|nr:hypothetical protein [Candidatus Paracaedibacter symbiosus]
MLPYLLFLATAASASTPSQTAKFNLTREICAQLVVNNKPDDSINYSSGIDTKGKKVVPADLNGSPGTKNFGLGDEVHINLQAYMGRLVKPFPRPKKGNTDYVNPFINGSQVDIGSIDVHKDGKIWINGVPAFDEDQAKIEEACRKKFPNL